MVETSPPNLVTKARDEKDSKDDGIKQLTDTQAADLKRPGRLEKPNDPSYQ
jgi:hypothetical protein